VLFYGAERVYKTTNGGDYWNPISPNLTGGQSPGNLVYGTITTIDQSRLDSDIIWAGTDDSRVWVTTNGGGSWTMVSDSLPNRWCTRVTADLSHQSWAYVTFSGYKVDELLPHIFRTTDWGETWEDISGNLVDIPINDVLQDPDHPGRLFIGTDFGMYYTETGGQVWQVMGEGHSVCPVFDIHLHQGSRTLVSGTHGRSMYKFDLTQLDAVIAQAPKPTLAPARLEQNYTNPFNVSTVIPFELSKASHVTLQVYDVNGRLVATLMDRDAGQGRYRVPFEARDLASGTYFATLVVGDYRDVIKMVYVK
jgi:hypothetical protein